MNMIRIIAENQIKDWPGSKSLSSATLDAIAERDWNIRVRQGFKKQDPSCKICFCKINKAGFCNCE